MEVIFCTFCDADAVKFVLRLQDEVLPLCRRCADAFAAGQHEPKAVVAGTDEYEKLKRVVRLTDGTHVIVPF